MRTQIEEMDVELEQYHKSNSALELMIQVRAQRHTETSYPRNWQRGLTPRLRSMSAGAAAEDGGAAQGGPRAGE